MFIQLGFIYFLGESSQVLYLQITWREVTHMRTQELYCLPLDLPIPPPQWLSICSPYPTSAVTVLSQVQSGTSTIPGLLDSHLTLLQLQCLRGDHSDVNTFTLLKMCSNSSICLMKMLKTRAPPAPILLPPPTFSLSILESIVFLWTELLPVFLNSSLFFCDFIQRLQFWPTTASSQNDHHLSDHASVE